VSKAYNIKTCWIYDITAHDFYLLEENRKREQLERLSSIKKVLEYYETQKGIFSFYKDKEKGFSYYPLIYKEALIGLLAFSSAQKISQNILQDFLEQEFSIIVFILAQLLYEKSLSASVSQCNIEAINMMTSIIEALDVYTRDHSKNVANYSLLLAEELALSPHEIEIIYYGALFHDVGKIGIPINILQKQGSLAPEEYEIIKTHTSKGANILNKFSNFKPLVSITLYHHEMFGGGGYPEGLKGDKIPLGARIVSVADTYDAITTNRHYRKAQRGTRAIDVIKKNTPKQFDPTIVAALERIEKNL
jgi:putative nucleotidyltransferase with HDIG domain